MYEVAEIGIGVKPTRAYRPRTTNESRRQRSRLKGAKNLNRRASKYDSKLEHLKTLSQKMILYKAGQ